MSKNASDGRQRVIEAAASMLAMHGLQGISIREVTKFAKAPLGSTYHNFPDGKFQIVAEAIDWAGQQTLARLRACLAQDPQNGLQTFLLQWRQRLLDSGFRFGCPVVAAAIEASQEPEAEQVTAAVSQAFTAWQRLLAEHLLTLGHGATAAQTLALSIIASIEGAVALCRGHQNIQAFDAIVECIPLLVGRKVA